MNKTILITGTSTGLGRTAAQYFSQHGWNVVATMRRPEAQDEFASDANVPSNRLRHVTLFF